MTDPEVLLNFDITTHGRFYVQTLQMQQMMTSMAEDSNHTQQDVDEYGKQWGLVEAHPPLVCVSPALDLILSRPMDAAHLEFNGLSHLMHVLLRDGLLWNDALRTEYALELRVWKFPPGCRCLQSPLYHLTQYTLLDHAVWSVIVPFLL